MKYHLKHEWLHLSIDQTFDQHTIQDVLDHFCCAKKTRYLYFQNHEILLNHHLAHPSDVLHQKDILSIKAYAYEQPDFIAQDIPFKVIYEDDFLLIVDKPAHLLVHPDQKQGLDTLCNGIAYYYQQHHIQKKIRYIHRLDQDTTGLILFCKCAFLQPLLDQQLKKKDIQRFYLAQVEGHLSSPDWTKIHTSIARDRHHSNQYRVHTSGKEAITYYRTLRQQKNTSFVECYLETGRTHQIRVHLASIQHPICHDPIYGKKDSFPLALQAYKMILTHPLTQERLLVELPKEDLLTFRS